MTAKQIYTQQFAEKHERNLPSVICAACESRCAAALLVQIQGLKNIAGQFANARAPAVLTGHTEHDVAANKLGIKVLKRRTAG